MPSTFARISNTANLLVMLFATVLLLIIFGITVVAAAYKYTTTASITWAIGINQVLFPWVAALSTTVAFKYGEHIVLSFLAKHVPLYIGAFLRTLNYVLVGVFGLLLVFFGYEFMESSDQMVMISSTVQITGKWSAAALPVTGIVYCIHLLAGPDLLTVRSVLDELDDERST